MISPSDDPLQLLTWLGQHGWAIGISFHAQAWLCSIGPRTIGSVTWGMFEDIVLGQHPTSLLLAIREALSAFAVKHPEALA